MSTSFKVNFQGTKMELVVNQHKPQSEVVLYHVALLKKKEGFSLISSVSVCGIKKKSQCKCIIHYLTPNYHFLFVI